MSSVSIVSEENFITVVSDGLVTNLYEDIRHPIDDYPKFKLFGDNKFIAYTGHLEMMELISANLVKNYNGQSIDNIMKQIITLVNTSDLNEGVSANIAIGGFDLGGKAEIYVYETKKDKVVKKHDYHKNTQIITFYGPETDINIAKEKMNELITTYKPVNPREWVEVQRKYNSFVSQMDSTVNNKNFDVVLESPTN